MASLSFSTLFVLMVRSILIAIVCYDDSSYSCDAGTPRSITAKLQFQCAESAMNISHVYKHLGPFISGHMQCLIECLNGDECVAMDICIMAMAPNVTVGKTQEMCGLRDIKGGGVQYHGNGAQRGQYVNGEDICLNNDPGEVQN
jgi:hypothetical protein